MVDEFYNLPNPEKIKRIRMEKYHRHLTEKIFIGAKDGTLPPGATAKKIPVIVKRGTKVPLYETQIPIFNKIKDLSSVLLEATTSFGKTVVSCALCDYWVGKTLIVVHSSDMVNQFGDEIEKFLGIIPGKFYGSKKTFGEITITTTKSFVLHYDKFVEYGFNNLIRDEADREFTQPQWSALAKFPAVRKVGMTGTIATKFDEIINDSALCRFYGIHVKIEGENAKVLKEVFYHVYSKRYEDADGIPFTPQNDWIEFRKHLDDDLERKKEMCTYILNNVSKDDHTLILFDRVWDVEAFSNWFKKGRPEWNIGMLHGKVPKKLRDKRVESFKKNGGILFAQEKVAGRGFNVVKINKCFVMFPCKSETNLRQIIGRAIRPCLDKNSFIYTWTDSSLQFQHKQRQATIREFFPNVSITQLVK